MSSTKYWGGNMKIHKALLTMLILWVITGSVAFASAEVSEELDYAVSQAILDGCSGLSFISTYDEPMYEVLVEAHEILETKQDGDKVSVWVLASAGVFREHDNGNRINPARSDIPLALIFEKDNDGFRLLEYGEPSGDSWSNEIRNLFPESLQAKAFEGNHTLFESLPSIADEFYRQKKEGILSRGPWRIPIANDVNDPACQAIHDRFSRYPQWEGRSILTRSASEQLWFYLSIDGDNGYYSPCTFEKYDKSGNLLVHAVVQYIDGQLSLLDGALPPDDE